MTMKQVRFALLALTASLTFVPASTNAALLDVWIDFDGDKNGTYDPVYNASPGSSFTAHVYIQIDGTYDGLQSFGVELNFDPGVLMGAAAILYTANWPFPGQDNGIVGGRVDMVGGRLDGLQGQIHLFDVEFSATGPAGSSVVLTMGDVFPMATTFNGNVAASGFVYDNMLNYLPSEVHIIPIPGAAMLFFSALLVALGSRGERRQQ